MLKEQILNELANDKRYITYCKSALKRGDLYKDLYQFVMMLLCEMDEAKLNKIYNNNPYGYVTRMIYWNAISKTAPFFRYLKQDKNISLEGEKPSDIQSKLLYSIGLTTETVLDEENEDINNEELLQHVETFLKSEVEYWKSIGKDDGGLSVKLLERYTEVGSYRKIAREADIPYPTVRHTIKTLLNITGLNYHRQFQPHQHLQDNYEGYEYSKCYTLTNLTDEQIQEYDIVSFLRIAEDPSKVLDPTESIRRAKKLGCKTVLDIDDYWNLDPKHGQYNIYKETNYPHHAVEGLKAVDWVTTTTEHFADKIKEFNKNVTVLPNSINPTSPQFISKPTDNRRVRIGWIGGVFHAEDLKMVHSGFNQIWKEVNHSKFQFCLGGWNYPNKLEYVKQQAKYAPDKNIRNLFKTFENSLLLGKDVGDEYIFREEFGNIPPYDLIEGYMTDFLKYPKHDEYKNFLKQKVHDNDKGIKQSYRRLEGLKPDEYATLYNDIDVALVPLVENSFNSYKSQIKIIEAGYFKKAVIVSNVAPYTFDCNKDNSVLISPKEDWGAAMKSMIFNKNRREDLAEALHEHVMDNYLMDKTNKVRHQLYQTLNK
jgi:hypothetical protein